MTRDRQHSRKTAGAALAFLALGVTALAQAGGVPALASSARSAGVARTLNLRDEGSLQLVKRAGSLMLEEGTASGTLPGNMRVHFFYNGGPKVIALFTIYADGGSIRGHGLGRLNNPESSSPSFAGDLAISDGSGRYAHAHGRGKVYGVFYRSSDKLILQPRGQLRY
jgi:hypothetical protein